MLDIQIRRLESHLREAREGRTRCAMRFRESHPKRMMRALKKEEELKKAARKIKGKIKDGRLTARSGRFGSDATFKMKISVHEDLAEMLGSHGSVDFWEGQVLAFGIALDGLKLAKKAMVSLVQGP